MHGLVLTGGQSRRMGRDKAGIVHAGQTLLERAVELLEAELPRVYVSIRADQGQDALRGRFATLPDQLNGIGPAAGILAAHASAPDVAWLVLACDMPLVGRQEVQQLLAARDPAADATAFATARGADSEPLCAIYEPGTLANFAARIAAGGSPSPKSWLASVRTCLIVPASGRALTSVNTEEELRNLNQPG